jgi:hypothetical protein
MHSAPTTSQKIVNERKIFFLDLKENQRGRFLKSPRTWAAAERPSSSRRTLS